MDLVRNIEQVEAEGEAVPPTIETDVKMSGKSLVSVSLPN